MATKPLTLVIDQGTHATRALAVNYDGKVVASFFRNISLKRKNHDTVEQDAEEIVSSARYVLRSILSHETVKKQGISCAGIATQRSSVVAWDRKSGKPLAPVINWQDFRHAKWLKQFDSHAKKIRQTTGLRLSPHYGASKMRWYLDNIPAVKQAHRKNCLAMGPISSFLLFHLLDKKSFVVDHANVLRTQLINLQSLNWDPWLLELFSIPQNILPECLPVCHHYGNLQDTLIPVTAVNGDQNAAAYCLGKPHKNIAVVNIGTGAFILLPTGNIPFYEPSLLSGLVNSDGNKREFVIEGTVNGAGAALEWAEKNINIPDINHHLPLWLQKDDNIPVFANTIGGLGSPWWKKGPSPEIIGKSLPRQKAVAVAESIIFMLNANLRKIETCGLSVKGIQISGGLSKIDGICRRLSDISQKTVYRPAETEATARGIAWLAAGCPCHWPKPGRGKIFRPADNPQLLQRYKKFCRLLD